MGSINADIYGSSPVPRAVAALLQQGGRSCEAGWGTDHKLCWVLLHNQLCIWKCLDGVDARVITIRLPGQLATAGQLFVSVLGAAAGGGATALVCTDSGLIVAWPNVDYTTEPLLHQVPSPAGSAHVCACTAVAPAVSSGMLFVAALSMADGSCFLVQGNQQGMHSRQLVAGGPPAPEQRSVLSMLGSAIATAYTSAYDPNAKFIKSKASGKPALSITARMVDIHHLHVYVLTDSTLDCWQVTVGMRLSEQLLWSAHTVMAASSAARIPASAANAGLAVCGDTAYLLLAQRPTDGTPPSYWVHTMVMKPDMPPAHLSCAAMPPCGLQQQVPDVRAIYASPSEDAVLLMDAQHRLYEWVMGQQQQEEGAMEADDSSSSRCALVSDDPDTLAATSLDPAQKGAGEQAAEPVWLVLNATYGVVQLRVGSAGPAQTSATTPLLSLPSGVGACELSAEHKVQVMQVLDAQLAQADSVVNAAQPLLPLALALRCRLAGMGVLDSGAAAVVLAEYSTSLVDTLPKQWALGAGVGALMAGQGPSGSPHGLTAVLLSAKEAKHVLLLQCLSEGGILHALPPAILRVLVENGEKLSAAGRVLALHNYALAQQQQREAAGAGDGSLQTGLIAQVVKEAGLRLLTSGPQQHQQEGLPPMELFYSRPSSSLPALLWALREAAVQVQEQAGSGLGRPGDASSSLLAEHCSSLGSLLGEVMAAVTARREAVAAAYRLTSGQLYRSLQEPPWVADAGARDAMEVLTQACQAVRQLLLASAPSEAAGNVSGNHALPRQQLARMMFGCTEVLLSAYAAAVGAAPAASEQQAQLLSLYECARERCLGSLLEDARSEVDPRAPLPQDCLLLQVLQLSAAHHCYPCLFTACQLVDSWGTGQGALAAAGQGTGPTLHHHMAHVTAEEGASPTSTFARYCFQRLLDEHRPADLLQLPSSFYNDLRHFLQQQPQHTALLWPLLLRMREWGGALQAVVLNAQTRKDSYKDQHRLYCVAQLCATQASDGRAKAAISARLQQLSVQHRLLQLPGASEVCYPATSTTTASTAHMAQQPALELEQLVAAALQLEQQGAAGLQGRAATLALKALATCPTDVQQAHRSWLQAAWQQLLSATDWAALAAAHQAGSGSAGSGGAYLDALQATPVYQATLECREGGLFGQGGSIADSRPAHEMLSLIKQLAQGNTAMLQHGVQAFELALRLNS